MRFNWGGFGSFALSLATFTPFGRELIKSYFWDRVLHVMSPVLEPVTAIAMEYGPAVAFLLLGLYLSVHSEDRHYLKDWASNKLNGYYIVAGLGALICIGALFGAWLEYRRGPVAWITSTGSPIEFHKSAIGRPLIVTGFRLLGKNKTDRPVTFKDAYIKSDNTDQIARFKIGVLGGEITPDQATLEPHGSINMCSRYPAMADAPFEDYSADRFRSVFGRFTFHVEYGDGRTYEHYYSASEVNDLIKQAEEHENELLSKAPGVIRRSN